MRLLYRPDAPAARGPACHGLASVHGSGMWGSCPVVTPFAVAGRAGVNRSGHLALAPLISATTRRDHGRHGVRSQAIHAGAAGPCRSQGPRPRRAGRSVWSKRQRPCGTCLAPAGYCHQAPPAAARSGISHGTNRALTAPGLGHCPGPGAGNLQHRTDLSSRRLRRWPPRPPRLRRASGDETRRMVHPGRSG